jgi:hypothetical protein
MGGNSTLAAGLDQRVKASSESGKLSLSPAPPQPPQFQENDLSRNSPAQAQPNAARPHRLADEALAASGHSLDPWIGNTQR